MFCDKCGSKVNDGDIYCPNCNNKIITESQESNTPQEIATKPNPRKKKFVVCGVVIVIVLGIVSFFNSSIGKCFIANFFEINHMYKQAYDVVYNISGEKGEAKKEYYKLLIEVHDFVDGTAYVYTEGDFLGVGVGRNADGEEGDVHQEPYNSTTIICSLDDVSDIEYSVDMVSDYEYLLSNNQRNMLHEIESCIKKYNNEKDLADEFYENLSNAYDIYDTIEYFKTEQYFNPVDVKEEMENYNTCLGKAKEIYNNYISKNFYGYDEIQSTLNEFIPQMKDAIDKYGDKDDIHYTDLTGYEPPYVSSLEINDITDNFRLHIAKRCFDIDNI